jgi:hypothetical protein
LLGHTATAEAEPFVRNENRRPITKAALENPVEWILQGFNEAVAADHSRLARLYELLNTPGHDGTFQNWVEEKESVFGIPSSVEGTVSWAPGSDLTQAADLGETIYGNRPRPTVSIESTVTVTEPPVGATRVASFLVSLSHNFDQSVVVPFVVTNGSAVAGLNYTVANSLVVIRPGSLGTWINITIRNDRQATGTEKNYFIQLQPPTNGVLGFNTQATGIIRDSDLAWSVSGSVTVESYGTHSLAQSFLLPRAGGARSYGVEGIATAKVTISKSTVSVYISGFKVTSDGTGSGHASGSAPIVENLTTLSAAGPISGNVHIVYNDGTSCDFAVSGNFTATANK